MTGDVQNSVWSQELLKTIESLQGKDSKMLDNQQFEAILKEFSDTIGSYVSVEEKSILSNQINNVLSQITNLKAQTFQMGSDILKDNYIPDISVELHSVIAQTEKSVEGILDVSDAIRNISTGNVSADTKEDLMINSTKLLELCNFQDLTGQILQRIIKRLTTIETTIGNIFHILRQDPRVILTEIVEPVKTDSLLNGPQTEEERPSQSEVDDLFNRV